MQRQCVCMRRANKPVDFCQNSQLLPYQTICANWYAVASAMHTTCETSCRTYKMFIT